MQEITVEELKQRAEAGEKLNVIDVREPNEYAEANIGAKLIPLGAIMGMQIDEIEDLKNEEVIVHCKSGMRSTQACMMLDTLGFTNTKNVKGGILAWQEKYGADKIN
ncbi:MAG: rhodanese-like domain-containing protein [Sphingobacteriales bacterium]|nr:MAG: rhodanese-like domain-containing protein [Sphingobacteriales bacterium]